jgi:sortase A
MKLLISRAPVLRILRWTQVILLASAVLMLGYCAFVLTDTMIFQHGERRKLERLLIERAPRGSAKPPPAAVTDGSVGRLEIPRLRLSAMVVEGTGKTSLRRAVGHIQGTALPGQPGNIGISGHRDTFFRPLRNIRQDDVILFTTARGEFRYHVVSTMVVAPSDVAVLNSSGREILTLVTCYPFYFAGPAPKRFIVQATRSPLQPEEREIRVAE